MDLAMAQRLVDRRKAAGLSQEALAAQLGVSRQAVSKWERSESSPDTDNLIALAALYGMDEGLERRFLAAAQTCASREALLDFVKTKRYTRARLSRLCAYALLDLSRDFAQAHRAPEYARVLGFRRSAAPLLKAVKRRSAIPLVTKAADFDRAHPLFALDVRAQDLWSLGVSNPALRSSGRDFTTSPILV